MAPPSGTYQPKSGSITELRQPMRPPISTRTTAEGQIIMTLQMNHKANSGPPRTRLQAQTTLNRKRRHLMGILPHDHPLRDRTASKGVLLPPHQQHSPTSWPLPAPQAQPHEIPDAEEVLRAKQRKCKPSGEERESAAFNMSCTRLRHMWQRSDLNLSQEIERQSVRHKMEQQSRHLRLDRTLTGHLGASPPGLSRTLSLPHVGSHADQSNNHRGCRRRTNSTSATSAAMKKNSFSNNNTLTGEPNIGSPTSATANEQGHNEEEPEWLRELERRQTFNKHQTERDLELQTQHFLASSFWI